ncbi:MAG: hypothetical protein ACYCWE_19780 [Eubacteriales bacterium]
MNNIKKILSAVLAVLMLSSAFLSCSDKTDDSDAGTDTANVETQTATETEYMPDQLPEELDFEDAVCNIFCWDSWDAGEFFVEEDTGEIVNSAVYSRNLKVEERLGVKLVWDQRDRNSAAYGSAVKDAVSQQNASGDNFYDLMASYGMRIATASTNNMFMNLNDAEYMDLSNPWYYESAIQAGTLRNGYTYFFAGDISFNALARMSGVFFNRDMIENYHLDDPYDLVLDGKWTIDMMHEMIKNMYDDIDSDGKRSDADQYGIMVANDQVQTLYYGTGSHFIDHDENDSPKISDDVYSERTITILEKYLSLFSEDSAYKNPTGDEPKNFDEGRVLFYIYPLGHVSEQGMRTSEIEYGFIPQPKADESEKKFHASVTNAVTLFAIPLVIESTERASALAECLSSEGHRQVTPVVFEQAYKVKYNHDEGERQTIIFDMLRENIVFDLGKIFAESFGQFSNGVIGEFIWNNKSDFTSSVIAKKKQFETVVENLTKNLDK